MTDKTTLSRRELAGLAAAASVLAATPALANQVNMEKALSHCEAALKELQAATANKGGHRGNAIEHLKYVISEIKAGIAYAG